jgi:predicted metalloprotease with PDZ domain
MIVPRCIASALLCACVAVRPADAQEISYRVSIPEPEHHWLQVEATFRSVRPPLELRMSRSSPGRYALHEFAKNVYDVHAFDPNGRELALTRPDPYGWTVAEPGNTVRVVYKVFGEHLDGTYLAVDTTHAHMNMPATFMWARGMGDRPIRATFAAPPGTGWKVATQLFSTGDSWTFTAPNLQYFMDSPTEVGPVWEHTFTLSNPGGSGEARFRIALHHNGSDVDATAYAADVQKIVAEEAAIFGEMPPYEPGSYTFLADYLPYADGDGMEHRNSTVMTGRRSLSEPRGRVNALGTVAHEFFHCWNVERIRPASLEPFDFERANMSGELWLAEGFTSYYGSLVMHRAGLSDVGETLGDLGRLIDAVVNSPGRQARTAVEMSQMAPFVDGVRSVDQTNFDTTFVSYYTWGAGLGLALDLSLRDLTNGRVTLDDYMRALWRVHGSPGGPAPGLVARPYTRDDARARLADVSGDARFAEEFFSRYVEGHEAPDYGRLLGRAGLVLRRRQAGQPWIGDLTFQNDPQGIRLARLTAPGSPAYAAGLDEGDVIVSLGDRAIQSADELASAIAGRKPGDTVAIHFLRRGAPVSAQLTLAEDPALDIVTAESTGVTVTAAELQFRSAWLSSKR